MKLFSKILLAAACFGMILATMPSVKAQAAEPVTYTVRFDVNSKTWAVSSDLKNWGSDSMFQYFNDGDNIVVDGCNAADIKMGEFKVEKKVGQLAFTNGAQAIVYANGVDYAYTLSGTTGVIHSNVTKASVYDQSVMQIFGNVANFVEETNGVADNERVKATFAVTGTVDAATVRYNDSFDKPATIYSVAAGKLVSGYDGSESYKGAVVIDEANYSKTAPAAKPAEAPAKEEKQLDKVPKTGYGDSKAPYVMFGASAVFALLGLVLRKKNA